MVNEIRIVLLIIGALFILGILWDGLRRQRRQYGLTKPKKTKKAKASAESNNIAEIVAATKMEEEATYTYNAQDTAETEVDEEFVEDDEFIDKEDVIQAEVETDTAINAEAEPEFAAEAEFASEAEIEVEPETESVLAEQEDSLAEQNIEPEPEFETEHEVEIEPEAEPELEPELESEPELEVDDAPEAVEEDIVLVAEEAPVEQTQDQTAGLVMFTLVCKGRKLFGGFNLLQAILNADFRFGEGKIFHFRENGEEQGKILFSLAAATDTGEFVLSNMASFHCKGLLIFMHVKEHENPADVFEQMVEATEQLATRLDADLKIGHDQDWEEAELVAIHERLKSTD